jgi:hypothetical protein
MDDTRSVVESKIANEFGGEENGTNWAGVDLRLNVLKVRLEASVVRQYVSKYSCFQVSKCVNY